VTRGRNWPVAIRLWSDRHRVRSGMLNFDTVNIVKTCRCGACRPECMVERVSDEVWDRLVNLVQRMVNDSGEPEGFDAKRWLCTWLQEEVPSLGWRKPVIYLDSTDGEELVITTLMSMQSGAYR